MTDATYTYTGSEQTYTVPTTGTYDITALGAAGGGDANGGVGGNGAEIEESISLNAGDMLEIIVGGAGDPGSLSLFFGNGGGGGGGGSWVYDETTSQLLEVAGGGGGSDYGTSGYGGLTGASGGDSNRNSPGNYGTGGTDGGGGLGGSNGGFGNGGGGGGGFKGSGTAGGFYQSGGGGGGGGGFMGLAGGKAGRYAGAGGFGGGGGGGNGGGGGGGGYSGGGGGIFGGPQQGYVGGGGGSFTSGTVIAAVPDENAAAGSVTIDLLCFLEGTLIATPDGERPVESLTIGSAVSLADGTSAPVRWIGRRTLRATGANGYRFADPQVYMPVRIKAGALGDNLPLRDLLVSPDHAILVEDLLVQAGALVNGVSVVRQARLPETFTFYHIELAEHALVLAEGVPAETFVDNVHRMGFDNWAEHEALYGNEPTIVEMGYPRVQSLRQLPLEIRRLMRDRARALTDATTAESAAA